MTRFFKGILIGLGAVAPGLSGSILLVIFGLYQKTLEAISGLLKSFRKNFIFLFPLGCGILGGVILFSKLVDWLLLRYPMQTRFCFLGLILGSVPLFWREIRTKGFHKKYYFAIGAGFTVGFLLFDLNPGLFPQIVNPSLYQSMLLGLVVAASYIVPGIDSAAILSALGLYNLWVSSLANLDFSVLLPASVGLFVGVVTVSWIINKLIARWYTLTFSLIFGLFLTTIPSVLEESCAPALDLRTLVSALLLLAGFAASLLFSNLEKLKDKFKK